ncbi:MAG: hypothetical protein CMF27_05200 [Kiritimatiellaceae bacterium]|jgi:hypothetical protein|nr:hypothetical protein [Kiritimatiellaceae bacterium]|tara:strand:- start:10 stop:285 length:276 start_codon:yes stop_codon:yes gene_type:complete
MNTETLLFIGLIVFLIGHYISQKKLLQSGLKEEKPLSQLRRLLLSGLLLMGLAVWAVMRHEPPYGTWGSLLFIESAVSLSFARKLLKKALK